MTGYGRGEVDQNGTKFSVELNSVNRKQSDIVVNLPRDLAELEPRIRQTINENISRGRTNVVVTYHNGSNGPRKLALDTELVGAEAARPATEAPRTLRKHLFRWPAQTRRAGGMIAPKGGVGVSRRRSLGSGRCRCWG